MGTVNIATKFVEHRVRHRMHVALAGYPFVVRDSQRGNAALVLCRFRDESHVVSQAEAGQGLPDDACWQLLKVEVVIVLDRAR